MLRDGAGRRRRRRLLSDIEMANNEKVVQLIVVVFAFKAAVYSGDSASGNWRLFLEAWERERKEGGGG